MVRIYGCTRYLMPLAKDIILRRNASVSNPTLMIDELELPQPMFAYSVRKLTDSYTGSCLRVRRANDDSEEDIGFDSSGYLDVSAITSFVGSSNGYISAWYDQSGNANHATQSLATRQPRIVDTGSLQTDGTEGRAALLFISVEHLTGDYVGTRALDLIGSSQAWSISGVSSFKSSGGTNRVNAPFFQFPGVTFGIAYGDVASSTGFYDGTWRYVNTCAFTANEETLYTMVNIVTGNVFSMTKSENSSNTTETGTHGNANPGSYPVIIGSFEEGDSASRRSHTMQEIIYWSGSNLVTSTGSMLDNMRDFFGT